ncbi:MAG: RnfABCDGE type electron transport complex subunit G [Mariprofundales bacterium]|nr:RnfABCDGE type electron transport complex subunit G [Mariprofundales bacterium]
MNRQQWQMVAVLVVVVASAALLLSLANVGTHDAITAAREATLHRMLVQVMPDHDNNPVQQPIRIKGNDEPIYVARQHDRVTGFAWVVRAPDGYSGNIDILLGLTPNGAIHAIRIVRHQETPGLGDGIVRNHNWVDSFIGRTLDNAHWAVRKDGGDFDQFTGATISPRAVVNAVHRGLTWFHQHHKELIKLVNKHFSTPLSKKKE